jgi:hypothetical protein
MGRDGARTLDEFTNLALDHELERLSLESPGDGPGNGRAIRDRLDRLECGQRTMLAMLNASSRVLATLIRSLQARQ